MKYSFLFVIAAVFLVGCSGQEYSQSSPASEDADENFTIVASFYPLAFFAQEIVGEQGQVTNLAGAGDVHDYTPTPQDIRRITDADLFVYQGAGLEPWAEDVVAELDTVPVLEATAHTTLQASTSGEKHDEHADDAHDEHAHHDDHGHGEEKADAHHDDHAAEEDAHGHNHGAFDPHTWLDPVLAQDLVTALRDAIVAADPSNAAAYEANAATLLQKLADLDQQLTKGLANCSVQEAIVSHDAFGYVARRYSFTLHPIAGLSTQDVPSAARLAELSEEAQSGVTHILVEENSTQQFAQALLRETGLKTATVNPLGKGPSSSADDYFSTMEANLQAFRTALACE